MKILDLLHIIATSGSVALISNNPPGPLTSELEINIEKSTI